MKVITGRVFSFHSKLRIFLNNWLFLAFDLRPYYYLHRVWWRWDNLKQIPRIICCISNQWLACAACAGDSGWNHSILLQLWPVIIQEERWWWNFQSTQTNITLTLAWTNEPILNGLNYQNCNYPILPNWLMGDYWLSSKLIELIVPKPDTCWRLTHSCLERFSSAFPCYAPSVGWWCQLGSGQAISCPVDRVWIMRRDIKFIIAWRWSRCQEPIKNHVFQSLTL